MSLKDQDISRATQPSGLKRRTTRREVDSSGLFPNRRPLCRPSSAPPLTVLKTPSAEQR